MRMKRFMTSQFEPQHQLVSPHVHQVIANLFVIHINYFPIGTFYNESDCDSTEKRPK